MQHWVETSGLSKDTEVLILPSGILSSILSTETPQPVAALVKSPDWAWTNVLNRVAKTPALILVLAAIQDPGNLGTISRSAEAFGASGVICLPGTVNPWNQKAVRASAGSVFRMPMLSIGESETLEQLHKAGVHVLTTSVQGAQPAAHVDLTGPVAFVIGNEGNGVPAELAAKTDGAVTIPCPGPVESLNAAVAASVLLYEAARQRSVRSAGLTVSHGGPQ
ncbi:MAG TPA: RNA methyltransferase [Terracidiphilus sp.]|jgi:TrmH family RNA methyltransferase|nr:RNA methyltransferase [Terracidiphilus sp.]